MQDIFPYPPLFWRHELISMQQICFRNPLWAKKKSTALLAVEWLINLLFHETPMVDEAYHCARKYRAAPAAALYRLSLQLPV
jgi:hypothetical protein